MRAVQIRTGRSPFEVAALAASLLIGVALLLVPQRPQSLTHAQPGWVQAVWCGAAIFAGAVGLVGVYWPGAHRDSVRLELALSIELVGVFAFSCISTMDALALSAFGWVAIPSGLFTAAFAYGGWWRVGEIVRDRKRLARVVETGRVVEMPLIVEGDPD